MTEFEFVKKITGVKEFSILMYNLAIKSGSPVQLEKELSEEIPEAGLQTLRSVAQRGNYPLSLDGMQ